jgi:hypothetical protein
MVPGKKFQEQGRLPIKTAAIVIFIAGWNIPFFIGLAQHNIGGATDYAPVSLSFAFIFIVLTLLSEPFRVLILKEDREIKDIRKSLYFMLLIVSVLLAASISFQHIIPGNH